MPYTEPTSLAIVACPGGEAFANEVITHLKHMYKHRFTLKNDVLSKRYELTKEELIQRINLLNDLQTSDLCIKGATNKYRPPVLKVNTRFSYFANGEVKTELLDSVRGKDVFNISERRTFRKWGKIYRISSSRFLPVSPGPAAVIWESGASSSSRGASSSYFLSRTATSFEYSSG